MKSKTQTILFVFLLVILGGILFKCPYKLPYLGFYEIKIYPHRINSLERLENALKYFNGLELDLVYHSTNNYLDVNHPPAKSIDLSLETYLGHISNQQKPFLWLDIKNLDVNNADKIFNKLQELTIKYDYSKSLILIETQSPEALKIFTAAGYKTSYYLPANLNLLKGEALNTKLQKIANILEAQPEIGISTSYKDYEIIVKHFPTKKKYIWALTSSYSLDILKIRQILKDDLVEIVLTKFRTSSGNR